MSYGNYVGPRSVNSASVPQSRPIPGKNQVKNTAGGYVYQISDLDRFKRFLILGSEAGTYYANAKTLTFENAENIMKVLDKYGKEAVDIIIEVSLAGRAPKNDPALFAMAAATACKNEEVRKYALSNLHKVARISTHLFHFLSYVKEFRGWGRALKNAVGDWYNEKNPEKVAYQIIKYRQRDGWDHHDVLKLAHPKPKSPEHDDIYHWVRDNNPDVKNELIQMFRTIQDENCSLDTVLNLLATGKLPWEALPTKYLNELSVWSTLLPNMPATAMLRNLGKMTSIGVFNNRTNIEIVNKMFTDKTKIHEARIHPINIYIALRTYESGCGFRGGLTWTPSRTIVSALNTGYELAYQDLPKISGKVLVGLDVSGSMGSEAYNGVSARELSAAIIKALLCQMDEATVCAFSQGYGQARNFSVGYGGYSWNNRPNEANNFCGFYKFEIPPDASVTDIVGTSEKLSGMMTGTDCSIPARWSIANKKDYDAFITITDNETWAGDMHPSEALAIYRKMVNKPVKNIVLAVTPTQFSVADPNDPDSLDIAGFDSNVPNIIADFISDGKVESTESDID